MGPAKKIPTPLSESPLGPRTPERRKRRKRPRLSDPHPHGTAFANADSVDDNEDKLELDVDFTCWDETRKRFKPIDTVERVKLLQKLRMRYPQVEAVTVSIPYLIVECDGDVPPESEQCFMAAGLVCVFMAIGEAFPFGVEYIGEYGGKEGDDARDVPDDVYNDLRQFHVPSLDTFSWIHRRIPDAVHVSSYPQQLVVELSESDEVTFQTRLETLPERLGKLNIGYVNGDLIYYRNARVKAPNPRHYDSVFDDTDYLLEENGRTLRPGILLECRGAKQSDGSVQGQCYTNAGIKISRGDDMRITVASHGWDAVSEKAVFHGETNVGVIEECVGEDIGLLKPNVPFSNQFFDEDVCARKSLQSSLVPYGDFVVIDSAFTGKQRMRFFGLRTGLRRQPANYPGPKGEHEYAVIEQGIYCVRSQTINAEPQIRDGVCGAPLIHQGAAQYDNSVLPEGGVLGFMLYPDVKGYNQSSKIYCYCRTVDPLIAAGWEVCQ
jgi:hypothetical protein